MSRFRHTLRIATIGLAPALCAGSIAMRRTPIRFDSAQPVGSRSSVRIHGPDRGISPEFVEQVSRGSLAGFGTGMVLALFSRSLVLIGGLAAAALHLASRMGLDLPSLLGLDRTLFSESRFVKIWRGKPWLTSSFLVTFVLSAFVRL